MSMLYNGSRLAVKGEIVPVEINEEVVGRISRLLAVSLLINNDGAQRLLNQDQAEAGFAHALRLVLVANSGRRGLRDLVPIFLEDIMKPISTDFHGCRIHVAELAEPVRPDSYGIFLDVLHSLGIKVGRVLPIGPEEMGNVLSIGVMDIAGVENLVGVTTQVTIEELILRSMLNVQQEEQDKLQRIIGQFEYMYVSRDELVRQWAGSLPVGKR